jgi:hypothetical protein
MTLIALANMVLWAGVITAILFFLMRQARDLDAEAAVLESKQQADEE